MSSRIFAGCILGLVLAAPQVVLAQYGRYRGGVVWGPDGPLYDTRSPEWRMSGGNIFVYQELMRQKLLLQQQKLRLRQQQLVARQMRQGMHNGESNHQPAIAAQPARRRHKALSATGAKPTPTAGQSKTGQSDAPSKPGASPPGGTETPAVSPLPD
jgi:hypothetical protein